MNSWRGRGAITDDAIDAVNLAMSARIIDAPNNKQAAIKGTRSIFILVLILVLGLHLCLLLLMDQLWQQQGAHLSMTSAKAASVTPKVQAYVVFATQTSPIQTKVTQIKPIQTRVTQAKAIQTKAIEVKVTQAKSTLTKAQDKHRPQQAQMSHDPVPKQTAVTTLTSSVSRVTELAVAPSKEQLAAELKSEYAAPALTRKNSGSVIFRAPTAPSAKQPFQIMTSLNSASSQYLARQRNNAFDELVSSEASEYVSPKSMSEMDGDMIYIELENIEEWHRDGTLDNVMDPNKIVKNGNTCYRVVHTPTPLNPHAQNLGFPFKCGEDPVTAAVKRAIANRIQR